MFSKFFKTVVGIETLGFIVVLPDTQPDPVLVRLTGQLQSMVNEQFTVAFPLMALEQINPLDFKAIFQFLLGLGTAPVEFELASPVPIDSEDIGRRLRMQKL